VSLRFTSLVAHELVQHELPMPAPFLKEAFVVLKQSLGFRRIVSTPGHLLDQDNLLGYEPLARGNVNIYRGEVLAVFPSIGHGAADNEPLI
jgi:hypothetical protein